MKLGGRYKNTIANLASRIWTMLANFIFVPLYIRYLGEEAFGLVTFFVTLQTVLNLLGLGFSKTLRREFASDVTSGKTNEYKYKLLRSIETICWMIALVIIALCFFFSTFIAQKWLSFEKLSQDTVSLTIFLMGISIGIQLIANVYLGCLFGQEKQVQADTIQFIWSLVKNAGVVIVISLVAADIRLFYVWYIFIDIIYMLFIRYFVIHYLAESTTKLNWSFRDFIALKNVYGFAIGIMFISIGYALNSQVDKIIISNRFSLTIVGSYNSTYNLSYVASIIASAAGIAIFPRFTSLFTAKSIEDQKALYLKVNGIVNIFSSTLGAFIAVFSYDILKVWTGSSEIASTMQNAGLYLILGTTISAFQEIPYNYFLACGVTLVNAIQTGCSIIYVLLITPIFINHLGILGAAISWLVEMLLSTTIYLLVFYKKYFNNNIFKYIVIDTYSPLGISLICAFFLRRFLQYLKLDVLSTIAIAILSGVVVLVFMLYLKNQKYFIKYIFQGKIK